jgi:DNA-binding NarL/FixJ family response regulator
LINVGVVAAARAMRIGLREVLNGLPELNVVAEATRLEDLVEEVEVLVLASPAGFEGCTAGRAILLLSDNPDEAQELFELDLPAWGVLPVNASEDELKAALGALAEGLWVGAPGLMRDLLARKPASPVYENEGEVQALTERETEVLQLTAQGLANKQIALRLGISEHTVKFHLSSLYAKLGVTSRTEAVRSGSRRGLVTL